MFQARWRHVDRTVPPRFPPDPSPVNLTSRLGGLRQVPRAQAPADLWYYGKMPFRDSDLRRHRGNPGYSSNMAELSPQLVDTGTYGVRVTSIPPTASIERIREAMNAPDLSRGTTFSVRIDPASLYEPMSYVWRQLCWTAGCGPNAQLLTTTAGPANMFIVRSNSWGTLKLGTGQFHVEPTLPPQAAP